MILILRKYLIGLCSLVFVLEGSQLEHDSPLLSARMYNLTNFNSTASEVKQFHPNDSLFQNICLNRIVVCKDDTLRPNFKSYSKIIRFSTFCDFQPITFEIGLLDDKNFDVIVKYATGKDFVKVGKAFLLYKISDGATIKMKSVVFEKRDNLILSLFALYENVAPIDMKYKGLPDMENNSRPTFTFDTKRRYEYLNFQARGMDEVYYRYNLDYKSYTLDKFDIIEKKWVELIKIYFKDDPKLMEILKNVN